MRKNATERILKLTANTHRTWEVHDGASTMDFMDQEAERGITIQSTVTTCFWKDQQLNVISTPGHMDLNNEVRTALLENSFRSTRVHGLLLVMGTV